MQEGSTGLYYMRSRYYDSTTARFLSPDLMQSLDPMETSPYQYARSNPIGYADPLGLDPQDYEDLESFIRQFFGEPDDLDYGIFDIRFCGFDKDTLFCVDREEEARLRYDRLKYEQRKRTGNRKAAHNPGEPSLKNTESTSSAVAGATDFKRAVPPVPASPASAGLGVTITAGVPGTGTTVEYGPHSTFVEFPPGTIFHKTIYTYTDPENGLPSAASTDLIDLRKRRPGPRKRRQADYAHGYGFINGNGVPEYVCNGCNPQN